MTSRAPKDSRLKRQRRKAGAGNKMVKRAKTKKKVKSGNAVQEPERRSFVAIKDAMAGIARNFSDGADKVADILLDEKVKKKNQTGEKIKKETVSAFKALSSGVKQNLNGISLRDILCDTLYNTGRAAKITKDTCIEIFNDIME